MKIREAALRLVPTSVDQVPAHLELKVADLGANPYLLLGSLQVLALAALARSCPCRSWCAVILRALTAQPQPIPGLPRSLAEARMALASSAVLSVAMGELLHGSVLDSIDAEIARCDGLAPRIR